MFFDHTSISIPLTQGKFAKVDFIDADLALLKWTFTHHGYALRIRDTRNSKSGHLWMHRIILERKIGRALVKGEVCDHIDSNKLNNSRSNLRIANAAENARNALKAKSNKSGYKGVHFAKHAKRWCAQITVNRKCIPLGYFDTPEAAAFAYNEAAAEFHGKFAKLNEVKQPSP